MLNISKIKSVIRHKNINTDICITNTFFFFVITNINVAIFPMLAISNAISIYFITILGAYHFFQCTLCASESELGISASWRAREHLPADGIINSAHNSSFFLSKIQQHAMQFPSLNCMSYIFLLQQLVLRSLLLLLFPGVASAARGKLL